MNVNVNVVVVCGFPGCPWSMEVDRSSGADPMAVHQAYLDHLDEHDLDDGEAECEAADRWVSVAQTLIEECPSCHAAKDQPHTDYCKLPKWAAHDAEVARALAEDPIPGAGGFYNGQLYPPPKPEDQVPAGTILCSDPACVMGRWKHSHPEGWPEHPSYKGGLYAGDTPEQIAAEQARVDRFMAGGNDQ